MLHFSCAWAVVPECVAYAERRESHKSPEIYSKGVAFKTDPYILRVNSLSIDFIISIINNVIEAKPSLEVIARKSLKSQVKSIAFSLL